MQEVWQLESDEDADGLKKTMIGLNLIAVVLLLQIANAQSQMCSTEKVRRAALHEALTTSGCNNYNCGKSCALYKI